MAENQVLNSKVIEKSEEMTKVADREESDYRWSTETSEEKRC